MTVDLESRSDSLQRTPASAPEESACPRRTGIRRAHSALEQHTHGEIAGGGGRQPARIGRYVLLGQVAGGGMGSVFVALLRGPAGFSRRVAIKCLHTRWLDDPKYVARFATEVKLTTLIRHPNVVQALDVVEEAGELFLVMDYVDGVTLAALLADLSRCERTLPIGFASSIMAAALRGLHAAHQATDESGAPCHIVHRDVSPQNIMISRNGHVMVLDFGAAKSAEHAQLTAAGVLVGKLAYMAPEQVRGERSSPRTDVFSAGVVLWEALVGKRLFHDPTLNRGELLHALAIKPIERPSRLRGDIPRAVDEVVRRALERNPERRFQSALEFAEALDAAGAASASGLGPLVRDVCGQRLAEKEALLREGLRAVEAEATAEQPTALQHALTVQPPAGPLHRLVAPAHARRGPLAAWLAAAALVGASAAPVLDAVRDAGRGRLAPLAAAAKPSPASELGHGQPSAPIALMLGVDGIHEQRTAAASVSASPLAGARASAEARNVDPAPAAERPARSGANGEPARRKSLPRGADNARGTRSASVRVHGEGALACDPPTFVDAAGIRHFKKDCL